MKGGVTYDVPGSAALCVELQAKDGKVVAAAMKNSEWPTFENCACGRQRRRSRSMRIELRRECVARERVHFAISLFAQRCPFQQTLLKEARTRVGESLPGFCNMRLRPHPKSRVTCGSPGTFNSSTALILPLLSAAPSTFDVCSTDC